MSDRAFIAQLQSCGLTTAEVHYYRPDAPSLLQISIWQEYDLAPDFPVLFGFLDHWRREIEAALHSVRIAHDALIRPTEWRGQRRDQAPVTRGPIQRWRERVRRTVRIVLTFDDIMEFALALLSVSPAELETLG